MHSGVWMYDVRSGAAGVRTFGYRSQERRLVSFPVVIAPLFMRLFPSPGEDFNAVSLLPGWIRLEIRAKSCCWK